jgi:hypothetical protein
VSLLAGSLKAAAPSAELAPARRAPSSATGNLTTLSLRRPIWHPDPERLNGPPGSGRPPERRLIGQG